MNRISFNHKSRCVRVCEGGHHGRQTYFGYSKYGSVEAAYRAALAYEQSLLESVRMGRHKPRSRATKASQSGIVGVHPYINACSDEQAGWRATWVEHIGDEHKKRTKDFSFFRYGEEAKDRAIRCRQEAVARYGF